MKNKANDAFDRDEAIRLTIGAVTYTLVVVSIVLMLIGFFTHLETDKVFLFTTGGFSTVTSAVCFLIFLADAQLSRGLAALAFSINATMCLTMGFTS